MNFLRLLFIHCIILLFLFKICIYEENIAYDFAEAVNI